MSDNNDFGTFFAGLIVGGLVGAAVALLMAPQSGEETRTYIRDKGIELKDRAVQTSADARARTEQAFEDARVRAEAAMEDLRMRADEMARAARGPAGTQPAPEDVPPAVGE